MSEDDTFRLLKRLPLNEVLRLRHGVWGPEERKKIILDSGWTLDEFFDARASQVFSHEKEGIILKG